MKKYLTVRDPAFLRGVLIFSSLRCVIPLLSLVLLGFSGCGSDGPQQYPVTGKVTYDGKPVTTGTIVFQLADGSSGSTGTIQPDGSYVIESRVTGVGSLPGECKVAIIASEMVGGRRIEKSDFSEKAQEQMEKLGEVPFGVVGQPRLKWIVPELYSDTSTTPLTATVEEKDNEINFDLP